MNINRILAAASQMMEARHYAASHIRAAAARLDRVWKEFAAGLDERTSVLALSVLFHHKAEQVSGCFFLFFFTVHFSQFDFHNLKLHTTKFASHTLRDQSHHLFLLGYILSCNFC